MSRFALVTGASRGVGRAVATHLSREGFSLIITARNEADLTEVIADLTGTGHLAIKADLSTAGGVNSLADSVQQFIGGNGLHVFVHCAAQTPDPVAEASLADTTNETLDAHLNTTAAAGMRLLRQLKPMLATPGRAHAILMASDWIIDGITGPPIFAAAKTFVAAMWRHARVEYIKEGIILSSIVAGNIASYDEAWEVPKWRIDDTIDAVQSELGISRISLQDITGIVGLIIQSPLAAITEVRVVPLDPEYKP